MQKTGFENGFEIFERTHQLLVEYSNTGYEKRNDRKLIINDLLKLVTWSCDKL